MSKMTSAEVVVKVYDSNPWPKPTDVKPLPGSVYYTVGCRSFWVDLNLNVLERDGGKLFASPFAARQQALLMGLKRNDAGEYKGSLG